jgi:hypothetical protein
MPVMMPLSDRAWPYKLRQIAPKSSGNQPQQLHPCKGDVQLSTNEKRERCSLLKSHISSSVPISPFVNPQPFHTERGAQSYHWVPPSTMAPRPAASAMLLGQAALIRKLERRVTALEKKMKKVKISQITADLLADIS